MAGSILLLLHKRRATSRPGNGYDVDATPGPWEQIDLEKPCRSPQRTPRKLDSGAKIGLATFLATLVGFGLQKCEHFLRLGYHITSSMIGLVEEGYDTTSTVIGLLEEGYHTTNRVIGLAEEG